MVLVALKDKRIEITECPSNSHAAPLHTPQKNLKHFFLMNVYSVFYSLQFDNNSRTIRRQKEKYRTSVTKIVQQTLLGANMRNRKRMCVCITCPGDIILLKKYYRIFVCLFSPGWVISRSSLVSLRNLNKRTLSTRARHYFFLITSTTPRRVEAYTFQHDIIIVFGVCTIESALIIIICLYTTVREPYGSYTS